MGPTSPLVGSGGRFHSGRPRPETGGIGGFGDIGWVSPDRYRSATPDPLARDAHGIIRHMNEDHPDALFTYVKAFGDTAETRQAARKFLEGLTAHLNEAGLGGVSEVADGDAPHRPEGCPWQAWSVAEPLRALCEDVLKTHPHAASAARELQPAAR